MCTAMSTQSPMMRRMLSTQSSLQGRRRVVVTGMGLVTSLGVGLQHVWSRLCDGESGISALTEPEYEKIPCKVGGQIPRGPGSGELDLEKYFSKGELRNTFEGTCFAVVASDEALSMAKWKPTTDNDKQRTGVAMGMGMVDMMNIYDTGVALNDRGYNRVNPHFIPRILVNMPAGHISQRYGLMGPNHSVSTACATGVHSIGDAASFIRGGRADVMVCGGTEGSLNPLSVAGFARMRALSTKFNDEPHTASRPFCSARDGFVMSEGAGVLVLEELNHALNRGAEIFGEVLGYGLAGDANHITAPREDGDGAYRCMLEAVVEATIAETETESEENKSALGSVLSNTFLAEYISDASSSSGTLPLEVENLLNRIGYINAHATSTPLGDVAEIRAIRRLFHNHFHTNSDNINTTSNSNTSGPAVSSTKGATGHLLGAAGSVEAIFTLMSCHSGVIPPTLNLHSPDEETIGINLVPLKSQTWTKGSDNQKRIALTNSFGFGGTNASLCVSEYVDR